MIQQAEQYAQKAGLGVNYCEKNASQTRLKTHIRIEECGNGFVVTAFHNVPDQQFVAKTKHEILQIISELLILHK